MVNTAFDRSKASSRDTLGPSAAGTGAAGLRTAGRLVAGTAVDVRSRYVGAWSSGFEVAEPVNDGYRVRRLSDGSVLPDVFTNDDVRAQRHKTGLWWY
jgi:hypothetical protein